MSDQVTITPEMASDREDHKPAIDDQYPDHLVTFDGPDDSYNPMNWPFRKKFITTISYGLTTCWITLASAIFAAAIEPVSAEFNVNTETSAAATSLLVFGFGLGPLVWGPLSELYGRKWLILIVSLYFSLQARLLTDTALLHRCGIFVRYSYSKRYPNSSHHAFFLGSIWQRACYDYWRCYGGYMGSSPTW